MGYEEMVENKYENARRRTASVLRREGVGKHDGKIMRNRVEMSCEYKP